MSEISIMRQPCKTLIKRKSEQEVFYENRRREREALIKERLYKRLNAGLGVKKRISGFNPKKVRL